MKMKMMMLMMRIRILNIMMTIVIISIAFSSSYEIIFDTILHYIYHKPASRGYHMHHYYKKRPTGCKCWHATYIIYTYIYSYIYADDNNNTRMIMIVMVLMMISIHRLDSTRLEPGADASGIDNRANRLVAKL